MMRKLLITLLVSLLFCGCSIVSETVIDSLEIFEQRPDLITLIGEGWEFYVLENKLLLIKRSSDKIEVLDYFDVIDDN